MAAITHPTDWNSLLLRDAWEEYRAFAAEWHLDVDPISIIRTRLHGDEYYERYIYTQETHDASEIKDKWVKGDFPLREHLYSDACTWFVKLQRMIFAHAIAHRQGKTVFMPLGYTILEFWRRPWEIFCKDLAPGLHDAETGQWGFRYCEEINPSTGEFSYKRHSRSGSLVATYDPEGNWYKVWTDPGAKRGHFFGAYLFEDLAYAIEALETYYDPNPGPFTPTTTTSLPTSLTDIDTSGTPTSATPYSGTFTEWPTPPDSYSFPPSWPPSLYTSPHPTTYPVTPTGWQPTEGTA